MTEQEAQDREVTVGPDAITDGKIALSLTAHAGRQAHTQTLRLTSVEVVEVHRALGAFLASRSPEAAPAKPVSDTDRAALIARIQREMESYDPETLGDDPAVFDSWNLLHDARTALIASQPVQVEVTTGEVAPDVDA